MQITQFVLGASFAMVHSFVSYIIPLSIKPAAAAATAAAEDSTLLPAIAAGAFDSLRQLVFGTAGDQAPVKASTSGTAAAAADTLIYVAQPCIVTAGETFAIMLNVLYLAPLTYLFVSFFIASYVKRSNAASRLKGRKAGRRLSNVTLAEKAGWDAARGVEKEVYGGENMVRPGKGSPRK